MIAIGICWFGMSRAYVVEGSVEVTAAFSSTRFYQRWSKTIYLDSMEIAQKMSSAIWIRLRPTPPKQP